VDLLFVMVLVSSVAALASHVGVKRREPRVRARRVLAGMRDTPIANIKDGTRVRVTGVVAVHRETATSPVEWGRCLGFRLIVQDSDKGAPDLEQQAVLVREDCRPFIIADATGRAIVEGPFLLGIDPKVPGWAKLPPVVNAWLQEARVSLTSTLGHKRRFQYREVVLAPGDRVSVLGRASIEIDPAGRSMGHRNLPMVCKIRGDQKDPVIVGEADDKILSDAVADADEPSVT